MPYINAQIILPVLFAVGLFLLVYSSGISTLNEKSKSGDLRISAETLSEVEQENKFALFDSANLTNPAVYSEGVKVFGNLFAVETISETMKMKFVLPKKIQTLEVAATEKIIFVEPTGETVVTVAPDTAKAESEPTSFLGFSSGQKTVTPALDAAIVATPDGAAQTAFTFEKTEESWVSAFSHKIPMLIFVVIAAMLLVLSLVKKLSLIPILGLLSCLYLMTELGVTNWLRFGAWLLVGLAIYALYGYRNSKLHRREEAVER